MEKITLSFIPNLRLRNAVGKFLNRLYQFKIWWDVRQSRKQYQRGEYYRLASIEDIEHISE